MTIDLAVLVAALREQAEEHRRMVGEPGYFAHRLYAAAGSFDDVADWIETTYAESL